MNVLPTITITSPAGNSSFAESSNITINATASDADGSVRVVEFYNGSTKLGAVSSAPYSFTWNSVPAGNYSITAVATDNNNASNTSSAVLLAVSGNSHYRNKHPYIKISNPRKGNTYTNLTTITIDAVASDSDGVVKKVEFFNGSSRLIELSEAPYTFTWKDVLPGTYTITAVATDNLSDTTISSPIEFIVGTTSRYDPNSEIVKLYPNPNDGHFSIEFINPMASEKGDIIITDLGGKMVYSGPVLKEELKKQIDLSGSKSGVYVMMIKDKEILVTKKFIKN
jgi:chitinase